MTKQHIKLGFFLYFIQIDSKLKFFLNVLHTRKSHTQVIQVKLHLRIHYPCFALTQSPHGVKDTEEEKIYSRHLHQQRSVPTPALILIKIIDEGKEQAASHESGMNVLWFWSQI